MELVRSYGLMEHTMWGNIALGRSMVKESSFGLMDQFMKATSIRTPCTEQALLLKKTDKSTKGNGRMI
jgi:hypothetical protein